MLKLFVQLLSLISLVFLVLGSDAQQLPRLVSDSLERDEIKGKVTILTAQKPYLLKGDFDGDGKTDYVLAIKGVKTKRNGVLICLGKNETVLLGADVSKKTPFSDRYNDNFVAPRWRVMSKKEAAALYNYEGEKPVKVASPKGDSIAMVWEDGICLIYWDGYHYRWGCGQ